MMVWCDGKLREKSFYRKHKVPLRMLFSVRHERKKPLSLSLQVYTVPIPEGSWLDFIEPPHFSDDGKSCLMRIPRRDGEAGHFRHIVWLNVSSGSEIPITYGPFEVTEIVAWDQSTQNMYVRNFINTIWQLLSKYCIKSFSSLFIASHRMIPQLSQYPAVHFLEIVF